MIEILGNDRTSYWIVYFYQLIGGFFLAQTLVRLQNYQIYCMICATAQIEILANRVKSIGYEDMTVDEGNDSDYENRLLECMNYHKLLMR